MAGSRYHLRNFLIAACRNPIVIIRARGAEDPSFPDVPVVDSAHHLVDKVSDAIAPVLELRRFLIDGYLDYLGTRHNVIASNGTKGRSMYRATGPDVIRCVGEAVCLNGSAAMAARLVGCRPFNSGKLMPQ